MMGTTVGRTNTTFCDLKEPNNAYAFGLWCADGYHRTSSIGLTNVNHILIDEFRRFLLKFFPQERLKMRIYSRGESPEHYYSKKATRPAYQLYVNSRPFLRYFRVARENPGRFLNQHSIFAYFAGRFDGDGSVAADDRSDLRIAYSGNEEANRDARLLTRIGIVPKVYTYSKARTFVLYVSRFDAQKFLNGISEFSLRRRK